jgi:uncharacterized lipoprotein YajG
LNSQHEEQQLLRITHMSHHFRKTLILASVVLAAGCSTQQQTENTLEDPAYIAALEKQQEAVRSVKVYRRYRRPTGCRGGLWQQSYDDGRG